MCIRDRKYIGREPLYFEVEPETLSEIAGRRINYYERNGFHVVKMCIRDSQ